MTRRRRIIGRPLAVCAALAAVAALAPGVMAQTAPTADPTPTSKDFGSVNVGQSSSAQTFTLTNNGTAPLNVTSATLSSGGTQYVLSNNGCNGATVNPTQTCTVDVTFHPTTPGSHPGNLRFTDDAADSPQDVSLAGVGVAPTADPTPTSMNLGNVRVGQTTSSTLTVRNNGNATLNISSIAVNSGNASFSLANNNCPGTVAAGASCTTDVVFAPTSAGGKAGNVHIVDDAADSPQDVALSGTGTSPNVGIAPSSISFGSLTVGKKGTAQTITVTDTGTADLAVTTVAVTGTNIHSFSKTSDSCANSTVTAGNHCTIGIAFYPHAPGGLSATVQIHDDLGTQTVTMTGTGVRPANVPNVTKAVGCTRSLITWKPLSSTPGFLGVRIVRTRGRHIPIGPGDGTVRPKTSPGVLLDRGLLFGSQYNYGIFAEYRFTPGGPLVWSSGVRLSVRTQRICTPMFHVHTTKTTPTISWVPIPGAFYIVQVRDSANHVVFSHQGKATSVTVTAGRLHHGKGYHIFLFAYTKAHPHGRLVGNTTFTVV